MAVYQHLNYSINGIIMLHACPFYGSICIEEFLEQMVVHSIKLMYEVPVMYYIEFPAYLISSIIIECTHLQRVYM